MANDERIWSWSQVDTDRVKDMLSQAFVGTDASIEHRWPTTYAVDFFRLDIPMNRTDALDLLEQYVEKEGIPFHFFLVVLGIWGLTGAYPREMSMLIATNEVIREPIVLMAIHESKGD